MSTELLAALLGRPESAPVLVFVAGPNGAGKSTFVETFLDPLGLPLVNADRIARILRESEPRTPRRALERRAAEKADELREALVEAGLSFCTETVFSDPVGARLGFLQRARRAGFVTVLVFVGLASPMLSRARVIQRVRAGGHDIPDEKLRERYPRTHENLGAALAVVRHAFLFDNSSASEPFRPVAVYAEGTLRRRCPPTPRWAQNLPGLAEGADPQE